MWRHLFTPRQLVALTTFSDLVQEARERVRRDALAAGLANGGKLSPRAAMALAAYGDATAVYLAFAVDKLSDRHSTLGRWDPTPTASGIINTFSRQAIPMTWDYAEANPFSEASRKFRRGYRLDSKSDQRFTTCKPGRVRFRSRCIRSEP